MNILQKVRAKYWKPIFFVFLFLLSAKFVFATNFSDSDNSSNGFGGGTHTNTQWDAANSWLEMDSTGQTSGFATFTSRIIDAGISGPWQTLSWVPQRPLYKELPDSAGVESAYTSGNVDMTNNVLLLHLNESSGTSFSDTSGQTHTISCSNCPTLNETVRFLASPNFDGTNDTIDVNDAVDLDGSSAMTVSLWVNPDTLVTRDGIISKWNPTSGQSGNSWGMRIDNTNADELMVFLASSGSDVGSVLYTTSNANLSTGVWSHLLFVYDGSLSAANRLKIYVNGSLVSGSITGTLPTSLQNSNQKVAIGRAMLSNQTSFDGKIDEVALFQRALASTEVTNIYKRGALRARYQIRSCNDAACSGESFVGPGGVTNDYFEEQDSNTISLPSRDISLAVVNNQYFQYRIAMETASSTLSSEIMSVSMVGPTPGSFTVSSISGNTTEAGGTATYTIVLDSAPTDTVTVGVSSSDETEGTVSTSSIAFTSLNWSTPVTVTITGVSDGVVDGDVAYNIVNAAAVSNDSTYNGINPNDVAVTNTDSGDGGGGGGESIPEFSDFLSLCILGIGGLFIHSRIKKIQSVKS
jgi:hypothetical protein